MNNICITGRLTKAPELKSTLNGTSVVSVNVAVDRNYKVNGERTSDFIPVVFWRSTAEFVAKYFAKGDNIAIVGALESREYTDKDNKKRIVWEVVASDVSFCGSKKNDSLSSATIMAQNDNNAFEAEDDFPF